MLTEPPANNTHEDPRSLITYMVNLPILGMCRYDSLRELSKLLITNEVYGHSGKDCNADEIYSMGKDGIYDLIHVSQIYQYPTDLPLFDAKQNVILNPVGGTRNGYYLKNPINLAIETVYAYIFEHICSYSWVNVRKIKPDIHKYWAGEHYEYFISLIEVSSIDLMGEVEKVIVDDPDKVVEIDMIQGHLYIRKYCDYRTWKYIEMKEEVEHG